MEHGALNLDSPAGVRESVAQVCQMLLSEDIDARTTNALIYGCNAALSAMRVNEQQAELKKLKAKLDELEKIVKETERHDS